MLAEFLTDAQEQAYGHFVGPRSNQQLSRYFHLDDADHELVDVRRGAHNKLGFALQLTTVRFLGTFLTEPTTVPPNVVAYVGANLASAMSRVSRITLARPTTAREHAAEIRRLYGYRDFSHPSASFRLVRWLYRRAWLSTEPPNMLFDLAIAWLVESQVLLPGVSVLQRLVTRVRERANTRLYRMLAALPLEEQRERLRQLLVVPAGSRCSPLDRLRRVPTQPTSAGLIDALRRLRAARELGVADLNLSRLPPGRLKLLARSAGTARAHAGTPGRKGSGKHRFSQPRMRCSSRITRSSPSPPPSRRCFCARPRAPVA